MGIKPSVQRILKKYDRSIFKFSPNFLKVNFPLENVGENVGVTTIKLNNTQKIIISLINQDKYITQVEISEKLNKNIRTIEINMKKLQEKILLSESVQIQLGIGMSMNEKMTVPMASVPST